MKKIKKTKTAVPSPMNEKYREGYLVMLDLLLGRKKGKVKSKSKQKFIDKKPRVRGKKRKA